MKDKQIHFLSGLPRSGSTVLAAILNQNPAFHVTPTSGLIDFLGGVVSSWVGNPAVVAQKGKLDELYRLLRASIKAKYEEIEEPIVIDKSRGWPAPNIMKTMGEVLGQPPKIIATVRNIPDCAASFVRIVKPKDVPDFLLNSQAISHLKMSYAVLKEGMEAAPENFCVVDYDDLLRDPTKEMQKIHDFLGLEPFKYNFSYIEGESVNENDEEAWNIPGLHDVKSKLERQHNENSKDVLGDQYDSFCQPAFWRGEKKEDMETKLIDVQLAASLRGEYKLGWEISEQLEKEQPGNNRAAFNRGWYLLRQGKLQEGQKYLDRGRSESVFGNAPRNSPSPKWERQKGTVLLMLEGGLGDQIHGARFIKPIADYGCKVIVACSGELASLFKDCEGVSAIVDSSSMFGVYHDYWVPSMSAILPLGWEYKDVSGKPYISRPVLGSNARKRIGLRWQGNPRFEHEQHRIFDANLLFEAVKGIDADFISLQRDEGIEKKPEWVKEVPLTNWNQTREAIASCDLVITSCTSVAHLAAAMGVETWIIVPILPYYLWALPGQTTPWYDGVRLFRQTAHQNWSVVFEDIHHSLTNQK